MWEAAATLCFLPLLCLASWVASRVDRRGQVGHTVLYCTVLYCTVSPAQGDRSTKQLEVEVEDKQEIGDFSASYFKGHKNFDVIYFFEHKIFS